MSSLRICLVLLLTSLVSSNAQEPAAPIAGADGTKPSQTGLEGGGEPVGGWFKPDTAVKTSPVEVTPQGQGQTETGAVASETGGAPSTVEATPGGEQAVKATPPDQGTQVVQPPGFNWQQPAAGSQWGAGDLNSFTPVGFVGGSTTAFVPTVQAPVSIRQPRFEVPVAPPMAMPSLGMGPMSAMMSNPLFMMAMLGGDMPDMPATGRRSMMGRRGLPGMPNMPMPGMSMPGMRMPMPGMSMPDMPMSMPDMPMSMPGMQRSMPGGQRPMSGLSRQMQLRQNQLDRIARNRMTQRNTGSEATPQQQGPPTPRGVPRPDAPRFQTGSTSRPPMFGPRSDPPARPGMGLFGSRGSGRDVPSNMQQLRSNMGFQQMMRPSARSALAVSLADRRSNRADMMADYMDTMQGMGLASMLMGGGGMGMPGMGMPGMGMPGMGMPGMGMPGMGMPGMGMPMPGMEMSMPAMASGMALPGSPAPTAPSGAGSSGTSSVTSSRTSGASNAMRIPGMGLFGGGGMPSLMGGDMGGMLGMMAMMGGM